MLTAYHKRLTSDDAHVRLYVLVALPVVPLECCFVYVEFIHCCSAHTVLKK